MMRAITPGEEARPGDRLEVRGTPGAPTRRGVIEEVLGAPDHLHYLFRWDQEHESLFFPGAGEGVHVVHPRPRPRRGPSRKAR